MQIHGAAQAHASHNISGPHAARSLQIAPETRRSADVSDELQISESAQLASQLSDIPDIRVDRVATIRAAIADGTYDTDDKLDRALERLLDEIG
jgi:negative regulator of flagellin synthesis FlgM